MGKHLVRAMRPPELMLLGMQECVPILMVGLEQILRKWQINYAL
ncbi:hypothetical protein XGA_4794 [Xanthomonas hortorum ATCC 19865]|nr:hypothetical protein XGA_4794 [Xanthomonas hortorum ATCC 19865]